MLKRNSRPGHWAWWCVGAAAMVAGPSVAQAQTFEDFTDAQRSDTAADNDDNAAAPLGPAMPIELDLQSLIDGAGQGGQGQRFQGTAWDLRPEAGRRAVLVPIRITPGEAPYEISRPEVSLRSARFIGWYLPDTRDNANAGRGRNNAGRGGGDGAFRAGDSMDIEELLLGERSGDDRGRAELAGQLDALDRATDGQADSTVPFDAPRLARKFVVHPDGTIAWGMDRGFSGASVRPPGPQNRYGYKLDPESVQREEPARLERLVRQQNESSRDFSQRRREQAEGHRAALDEYRALREMVRELPDEFRGPAPDVVYAVFEAPESDGWSFSLPGGERWEIAQDDLDVVAALARGQGGSGLSDQAADAALVVNRMAGRGGELDQRIAALAVYQGQLAARVEHNDAGYLLLRTLLASDDEQARSATLVSIARVQPPTRATAQLLAEAARTASGDSAQALQLAALRSAFRIETGQGGNAGSLLAQANEALAAPTGPPAARVLEELIDAVNPATQNTGRGGADTTASATSDMLVTRIDFNQVREGEMDGVIAMVIRRAPDSPVAAGWLDQQLLRSTDARRTDRTLTLLGRADRSSALVQPLTDELRALVFGTPAAQPPANDAPVIDGVIALDSAQHGLVLALTSNDETRRALAWDALRHFEVVAADSAQNQDGREVFDRIVDIGLDVANHPDTPTSLVDFIDNPAQGTLAQHARVRMLELLLTEGIDPAVARRAARKVTGTGRDYSQPLAALQPAQRAAAVARVYELLTGEAPAVVGLLQSPSQQELARWIAQQWQQGTLPDAAAWARAAGDTEALLRSAGSGTPAISAAAASALVLQQGGTPEQEAELARKIAALADRSPQAVAAVWEPIKRDIFAARLSDTEGAYRLVLTLYPSAQAAPQQPNNPGRDPRGGRSPSRLAEPALAPPPPPGQDPFGPGGLPPQRAGNAQANHEPTKTIDLGIVQLTVNGDQVALSVETVPLKLADDILALQIEDVSTLTAFNHPDLADLPLSQLKEPLNLLPIDDNTWTGQLNLPDGRVLEVSLKRE